MQDILQNVDSFIRDIIELKRFIESNDDENEEVIKRKMLLLDIMTYFDHKHNMLLNITNPLFNRHNQNNIFDLDLDDEGNSDNSDNSDDSESSNSSTNKEDSDLETESNYSFRDKNEKILEEVDKNIALAQLEFMKIRMNKFFGNVIIGIKPIEENKYIIKSIDDE